MPAASIAYGTVNAYDVINESGLLVDSMRFTGERDFVERGALGTREMTYLRGDNPRLQIELTGAVIPSTGALAGVAAYGPGEAATLANFTTSDSVFDFDFTSGKLIVVRNPQLESSSGDTPAQLTLPMTYFQNISSTPL